jgi:hypothetical protein
MVESNNPKRRHITPHHIWACLHADKMTELSTAEHDHIVECEPCLRVFILCLRSKTFGSVLKTLGRDFDERVSA